MSHSECKWYKGCVSTTKLPIVYCEYHLPLFEAWYYRTEAKEAENYRLAELKYISGKKQWANDIDLAVETRRKLTGFY